MTVILRVASALGIFGLLSGCALFDQSPLAALDEKPDFSTPHQLISVWSDTVLHQINRQGTRGCGGRIMFYGPDGKQSVRVDGSVIIYAWDDSHENLQRKPDRKFVFTSDDLQNHYSASKIGHSYSFWVPWDAAGGPRRQLTLLTRFVGRNGAEVTSTPAKVILPGDVPMPHEIAQQEEKSAREKSKSGTFHAHRQTGSGTQEKTIQQAAYVVPADDADSLFADEPQQQQLSPIRTHEINLTSGFLQRNLNGPALPHDDLFGDAGSSQTTQSTRSELSRSDSGANDGSLFSVSDTEPHTLASKAVRSTNRNHPADEESTSATKILLQPPGRSLRFQDRVRKSRNLNHSRQSSRHSAGNGRFRSSTRTPPWEND